MRWEALLGLNRFAKYLVEEPPPAPILLTRLVPCRLFAFQLYV